MKKGFVRTVEAMLAVLLGFTFLLFIVPNESGDSGYENEKILQGFEQDPSFRDCAIGGNYSCIRSYIDLVMPVYYEYDVLVSDDPDEVIDLPEKRVHSESLFISGNTTEYSPVTVKLFYWVNE